MSSTPVCPTVDGKPVAGLINPSTHLNDALARELAAARALDDVEWRRRFCLIRPQTPNQLYSYIRTMLEFDIPRTPLAPGHQAPFDYVVHAFFEDAQAPNRDCLVWANRGGGKTQIAAIVTLLDLLFKPGIQIRILGGSFEQSSKMYRYLRTMLESDVFNDLIRGSLTGKHVELLNGSRVEVLSQSECSVRGHRVHKLRCDEVELFDRDVWEAAQLVTRSGQCGPFHVRAAIESLSTMHKPYGLMQELVRHAAARHCKVFRWSVLDTLQKCEKTRRCDQCALFPECQGKAKGDDAYGFFDIDDAIVQKRRVTPHTWAAEMLCEQPSRSNCVYPEFEHARHVEGDGEAIDARESLCIGGLDFGNRAPSVLLFAMLDGQGVIHIIDELWRENRLAEEFLSMAEEHIRQRGLPRPRWIGADPAGHQRNDHSGISTIALWKRAGWTVRTRVMRLEPGLELVRRRLLSADGTVKLRINARCERLIQAMTMYRYSNDESARATPVKDGHDHAADALRYMIVNLDATERPVKARDYLRGPVQAGRGKVGAGR